MIVLDNDSTLIFPNGNTRCIKSTSTPFAFEIYKEIEIS
jgi:hypothetical protein